MPDISLEQMKRDFEAALLLGLPKSLEPRKSKTAKLRAWKGFFSSFQNRQVLYRSRQYA